MPPRSPDWVAPNGGDGRGCENCTAPLIRRMHARYPENLATFKARRYCSLHCQCVSRTRAWSDPDGPPWTVDSNGCWIWDRSRNKLGYGILAIATRSTLAHVWVYEAEVGPVPEGLELDHLCRIPPCVRPDHLEPVTHAENMRRASFAKLTHERVAEIRQSGLSSRALAEMYGVSRDAIHRARTGRSWQVAG